MKTTQHTPGPWEITQADSKREIPCIWSETGMVAELSTFGAFQAAETFETVQANARLIAAAPSLLEALKMAEEVLAIARGLTKADYSIYDRIIAQGHAHEMKTIRAAIARAEGKA